MFGTAVGVVKVTALRICAPKLDPITIVIEDVEPGVGSLIVQCYDSAWYSWWGGMGEQSVAAFLGVVDAGYLAGCLGSSAQLKQNKNSREYLTRISQAIIDHFKPL